MSGNFRYRSLNRSRPGRQNRKFENSAKANGKLVIGVPLAHEIIKMGNAGRTGWDDMIQDSKGQKKADDV